MKFKRIHPDTYFICNIFLVCQSVCWILFKLLHSFSYCFTNTLADLKLETDFAIHFNPLKKYFLKIGVLDGLMIVQRLNKTNPKIVIWTLNKCVLALRL